jgi:hypothetical protein
VAQLERQVAQLSASLEALQAENAQLQRSNKRQAAPFSKGTQVRQPNRPGRKPGSGTFSFRRAPRPEEITESPVEVPLAKRLALVVAGGWKKRGWTWLISQTYLHCPAPR